jgi:hypothetical protein
MLNGRAAADTHVDSASTRAVAQTPHSGSDVRTGDCSAQTDCVSQARWFESDIHAEQQQLAEGPLKLQAANPAGAPQLALIPLWLYVSLLRIDLAAGRAAGLQSTSAPTTDVADATSHAAAQLDLDHQQSQMLQHQQAAC